MNDTTITPEERVKWRAGAQSLPYGQTCPEHVQTMRLLDAIEQAEARAEKAEKELAGADAEIAELRDELEDSRGTEKDAPNILCAIARLVGVYEHSQELGDDMGAMTIDAVCDLLAEKQKAEASAKDNSDALTAAYMSGKYDGRKEAEARAIKLKADIDAGAKDYSALMDRHDAQFVRAEKAEAENARLTKMVDWLAGALAEDGCPYLAYWADFGGDMRPDWCICTDTPDDGFDCTGNPKACWKKESTRRAVVGSEGEE